MSKEKLYPIKNYEGLYSITKSGLIYSQSRLVISGDSHRWVKGKYKKTFFSSGYPRVELCNHGKNSKFLIL